MANNRKKTTARDSTPDDGTVLGDSIEVKKTGQRGTTKKNAGRKGTAKNVADQAKQLNEAAGSKPSQDGEAVKPAMNEAHPRPRARSRVAPGPLLDEMVRLLAGQSAKQGAGEGNAALTRRCKKRAQKAQLAAGAGGAWDHEMPSNAMVLASMCLRESPTLNGQVGGILAALDRLDLAAVPPAHRPSTGPNPLETRLEAVSAGAKKAIRALQRDDETLFSVHSDLAEGQSDLAQRVQVLETEVASSANALEAERKHVATLGAAVAQLESTVARLVALSAPSQAKPAGLAKRSVDVASSLAPRKRMRSGTSSDTLTRPAAAAADDDDEDLGW